MWIALIGLVTTVSGGVFANWDRLFPQQQEQILEEYPPGAGAAEAEVAAPEDAASASDEAESEEAAASASSA
ncbi:hypothetical protein ASD88_01830 [Pelomonas sp. Root662]|nr:hypothetical protein ASC81_01830 [Pelomonas sp. Root405]KRA77643.1 hypothetical protein ASD88_01830 [Pelomonas sp. Root662]